MATTPQSFFARLESCAQAHRSLLCIGLDPDPASLPIPDLTAFLTGVIEATQDLVAAYKPNLAFYEGLGAEGWKALEAVRRAIPPSIPVIADAKRGDIASSARWYARALFDVWGFDAVTVNPYLGQDSVEPFLTYADRGVYLLCRTSNPGARDLQDLVFTSPYGGESLPLYQWVALCAQAWNTYGNVGLVMGATYPEEMAQVRALCPTLPLLVPGVGTQGGQVEQVVQKGLAIHGLGMIINVSRAVLYPGGSGSSWQERVRQAAQAWRERITSALEKAGRGWGDAPSP
ncbi:MAG: orotidine-5'-phosphate decarboxylase [Dehalococcoidia bacterium]|nr:orotidine-5'-phosphate decarboxylase [Dehalococcoidia bacterium]MDW8120113.1 orotidine-5'-phosphate decarboxylase [Chloroflexota bacterium]